MGLYGRILSLLEDDERLLRRRAAWDVVREGMDGANGTEAGASVPSPYAVQAMHSVIDQLQRARIMPDRHERRTNDGEMRLAWSSGAFHASIRILPTGRVVTTVVHRDETVHENDETWRPGWSPSMVVAHLRRLHAPTAAVRLPYEPVPIGAAMGPAC